MKLSSVKELLDLYQKGVRDFKNLELENDPKGFKGINLSKADFSGSFIVGDFEGANLQGSNFSNSNLKTSNFKLSDLRNSNFSNTALCSTTFEGANLINTNFNGAFYHSVTLSNGEVPSW